jgi:hypothetical protein
MNVMFDGGIAELTCTPRQVLGCVLVFDVALTAIQVNELQIQ